MIEPDFIEERLCGFDTMRDDRLGHLMVKHDGAITWDQLAAIKTAAWGPEARAIEVYPADAKIINHAPIRHLWRLGESDFCPDLSGIDSNASEDSLAVRHAFAWQGSRK